MPDSGPHRPREVGRTITGASSVGANSDGGAGKVRQEKTRESTGLSNSFRWALQQNLWVDRGMLGLCPRARDFLRHRSGVPRGDEKAPLRLGNRAGALDAPSAWLSLAGEVEQRAVVARCDELGGRIRVVAGTV